MRTLYFIMSGTLIGTGIAILIISKSLQLFGIWPLLVGLIGQWYGWKCVNSHDALLAACENLISEIDKDDYPTHTGMALLYKDELITAIAKAKEQL